MNNWPSFDCDYIGPLGDAYMQGDQIETAIDYYQKSIEMEIKVNGDKYKDSIVQMLNSLSVSQVEQTWKSEGIFWRIISSKIYSRTLSIVFFW